MFKDLLYNENVEFDEEDEFVKFLMGELMQRGLLRSEFDYCYIFAGMRHRSFVEQNLKIHGLKTGVLGGIALFAYYCGLPALLTILFGFLIARISLWYLNLWLECFAKLFYYFFAKRIYRKFKSQFVE